MLPPPLLPPPLLLLLLLGFTQSLHEAPSSLPASRSHAPQPPQPPPSRLLSHMSLRFVGRAGSL